MADDQHAPTSTQYKRNLRLRFLSRATSLAAGRRLLLRDVLLVEALPEPTSPIAEGDETSKDEAARYKEEKAAFFDSCTKERNRFIESKSDQSKTYDQTILTFSAGAIGLSITFVEKIAPSPLVPWLLYGAWSCFGVAVLSVVISLVLSQKAFDNEIAWVDASWEAVLKGETEPQAQRANRYTTYTVRLNWASGGFFVAGILFFVFFGIFNWPARREASKMTGTPIKIEITGEVMPGKMNVVTTSGAVVEVQKGNTPTPAMLTPVPTPPAPAPALAPTTTTKK